MFLNNKKTSTHSMHLPSTNDGAGVGVTNHNHFNSHHSINAKNTFSRLHAGTGGSYNCNGKSYAKRNSFISTRHDFIPNVHTEVSPRDSDSDEFRQMPLESSHSRTKLTFVPGHRELGGSQSRVNIFRQHNDFSTSSSGTGSYRAHPDKHAYNGPVAVHERKYVSPRRMPYNNNARRESNANYGNEIRDLPPDYVLKTYAMKRTQSHDRLVNQQRMNVMRRKTRPKSYCSNGANFATPI